jgi:hypothetical protein
MIPLDAVLWVKIVATAVLWAAPLLFFPARAFTSLGFPRPEPMIFVRLLGVAFLSLLVGYAQGLWALGHGGSAADTVVVGKVSNGFSCLLIVGYGAAGAYRTWGPLARAYLWLSAAVTGLVTLGLFVARG